METDDVIIADIGGQALDIFLHGPESARKNGIVKTFTHTCIPIQSCTLLKKEKKKEKKKKRQRERSKKKEEEENPQLTKHDASGYLSSSSSTWGWSTARSFAEAPQDCSTVEAFSPRTVLTENICRCVQQLLQHFQTTIAFLTTSTITFSCMAAAALQADSW